MLSAQVWRLLLLASFLGRTMSNEAVLLSESIDNLFLVNLPTEIPANTPSDTSKNATFPSSQLAFEVDNSLGLSEDAHDTSTSFAFGLDTPKQFYDQLFGSEYQPVAEQDLNTSIPLDNPANKQDYHLNDSGIYFSPLSPQQSSTASRHASPVTRLHQR